MQWVATGANQNQSGAPDTDLELSDLSPVSMKPALSCM
jgi:hypothetical protein